MRTDSAILGQDVGGNRAKQRRTNEKAPQKTKSEGRTEVEEAISLFKGIIVEETLGENDS